MNKLLLLGEITAIKKSNIKILLYFIPPTSLRREENKGKQKIPTVCLAAVVLSVSGWAEPRGVTDTCSWTQSVSSPNPTRANCSQMSSDICQLTPSESNSENASFYCLACQLPKPLLSVHNHPGVSSILCQYYTIHRHTDPCQPAAWIQRGWRGGWRPVLPLRLK